MSDITDQIEADAVKAQSVTSDGQSITRRSLSELIAADRHLRQTTATSPTTILATLRGMSLKVIPPGGP